MSNEKKTRLSHSVCISSPIFFSSDFPKQCKLNVDASDAGVGTALFQDISDSVDGDISYLEKLQITIELFYH